MDNLIFIDFDLISPNTQENNSSNSKILMELEIQTSIGFSLHHYLLNVFEQKIPTFPKIIMNSYSFQIYIHQFKGRKLKIYFQMEKIEVNYIRMKIFTKEKLGRELSNSFIDEFNNYLKNKIFIKYFSELF